MIKPVEVVTVSSKKTIFKDGSQANSIEVINFTYSDGNECAYNLIAQKDLYQVGDKAVFIQPDYCLTDNLLFTSFIRPGGDEKKSKLGKNFRIRAVKFNFSFENESTPIYSYGILLPFKEVVAFVTNSNGSGTVPRHVIEEMVSENESDYLQTALGITKYEEPESAGHGQSKGNMPSFLYKTDETNIENCKGLVIVALNDGEEIGGSVKRDGSSWTMYVKKDEESEWKYGICSRSLEKKLTPEVTIKKYDSDGNEYHPYLNKETNSTGWYCDALFKFQTEEETKDFTSKTEIVKDSWIEVAEKGGYIEKLFNYCKENGIQLAFRGELCGTGLKGSGNKNNPDSKNPQQIVLFGVDDLTSGYAIRVNNSSVHNLESIATKLQLPYATDEIVLQNISYDELAKECMAYFEKMKSKGQLIEGLVLRTKNSNRVSAKFMNPEYDSKK